MSFSGNGPYGDPTGYHVARVMEKFAAPTSVLDAPIDHLTTRPVVRNGYADDARTYPVHSPAAAWVSAAFYLESGAPDTKVAASIRDALTTYRLGREWARMEVLEATERTAKEAAAAPKRFALPAEKKYPIDTPEEIKRAAAYFMEHKDRFSGSNRRTFAAEVVKAAGDDSIRIDLDTAWRLESEAGLGRLAPSWKRVFHSRIKLASLNGNADLTTVLEKEASAAPSDPVALAGMLREVDRACKWDLPDPLTELISDTPTTATEKLAGLVRSATGKWYAKAALDAIPDKLITDLFADAPSLSFIDLDTTDVRGQSARFGLPVVSSAKKAELLMDPKFCDRLEAVLSDHDTQPVGQDPVKTDWAALARS